MPWRGLSRLSMSLTPPSGRRPTHGETDLRHMAGYGVSRQDSLEVRGLLQAPGDRPRTPGMKAAAPRDPHGAGRFPFDRDLLARGAADLGDGRQQGDRVRVLGAREELRGR